MIGYWSNVVSSHCSIPNLNDYGGQEKSGSLYCVKYNDGSVHDVFEIEIIIIASALLAVLGIFRANALYEQSN